VTRALVVIDGEHYAPVVRDAIAELPYEVTAAWLAGGTEKLRGGEEYGVALVDELEDGFAAADVVVDLSDEPVLGPPERFRVASRVLAAGLPYVGSDFRFDPPTLAPFELPSLGIVGTGKRVGKTAVSGSVARQLSRTRDVVVVAMGRGGPPEPELALAAPTLEALLELSRAGRHAASDYLEDAALARVVTVGCRRCGGGLAGAVAASNVLEGARIAAERRPDLVIFEGSGAAFPPVATRRRILVAGAGQPPEVVTGYLNAFRILVSDLVVVTPAEPGAALEELRQAIREVKDVPVVAAALRPRPAASIEGERIAFFTTAPEAAHGRLASHLRDEHGAAGVSVSGNLARRDALRADLARLEAETYLVEIKAAAIDVVAEIAAERGVRVVFADNEVVPLDGELDLEAEVEALAEAATAERVAA
jgi:cyclic 2,3-diphosphoglycerate synthetase